MTRWLCAFVAVTALSFAAAPVTAWAEPWRAKRADIDAAVAEAAASAGLPAAWIDAVIDVESGGYRRAVSRAGAMGLMQLMPPTWRDMRIELSLGSDPFDIRDNILAGAHYLRRMLDRFGPEGFLAAYNAGPSRYTQHLSGRPLPAETRAYVARLKPRLVGSPKGDREPVPQETRWPHSPLFPTEEVKPGA